MYIFIALSRDTPLAYFCPTQLNGPMAILAIFGHLWHSGHQANNMDKWSIPEKSYKNVVQRCQLNHCNMLLAHFIDKKLIFDYFPIEILIKTENTSKSTQTW